MLLLLLRTSTSGIDDDYISLTSCPDTVLLYKEVVVSAFSFQSGHILFSSPNHPARKLGLPAYSITIHPNGQMYLEICEWLGLYEKAMSSYRRKLRREFYINRTEHRKQCVDWIKRYKDEEKRGIAILQRQRGLKEEFMIATPFDEDRNRLKNNLSDCESISDQQNEQLREQYWLHVEKLREIEAEKPGGSLD